MQGSPRTSMGARMAPRFMALSSTTRRNTLRSLFVQLASPIPCSRASATFNYGTRCTSFEWILQARRGSLRAIRRTTVVPPRPGPMNAVQAVCSALRQGTVARCSKTLPTGRFFLGESFGSSTFCKLAGGSRRTSATLRAIRAGTGTAPSDLRHAVRCTVHGRPSARCTQ